LQINSRHFSKYAEDTFRCGFILIPLLIVFDWVSIMIPTYVRFERSTEGHFPYSDFSTKPNNRQHNSKTNVKFHASSESFWIDWYGSIVDCRHCGLALGSQHCLLHFN
jgi:hypothetical protein